MKNGRSLVDLAQELERQLELARHAGRTAQALRPAGYDAELVYLLALLQRLGRLVVQYHFPDEAAQIRRLMLPAPPPTPDQAQEPGMSEQAASYAVIGVDLDAVGTALAQAWGLDEAALTMVRRLPTDTAVHASERDVDALRWLQHNVFKTDKQRSVLVSEASCCGCSGRIYLISGRGDDFRAEVQA